MGMTLAEKILASRAGADRVSPGEIVIVPVDCAMMTDILGPRLIGPELDRLNAPIRHPERVVVVADHYTPSATEQQAEIVKYSRDWAGRNGIAHYYEYEGPCHQLLAEKGFSRPGHILVGTDSHSCTSGAFGCFGTGIGSTEMLGVLARGEIWFRVPESVRVTWEGALPAGVMAKDVALRSIGTIGHAGATYQSIEFAGSLVEELPMDERLCLSNMAVEAGAKVGLIAADELTLEYLAGHGVTDVDRSLMFRADPDAVYARRLDFRGEELVPSVACPHEVDNYDTVRNRAGLAIDQVYIGSCTGGRLTDLRAAAHVLKGGRVAKGCRLLISPASRRVWREALEEGLLGVLEAAGATILAPSCGACLGLHSGTIGRGERCVSTTNRNFIGRMGSKEGDVYLASAATAAATALHGALADPTEYFQA